MVRDVAFAGKPRRGRFVLATHGERTLAALAEGRTADSAAVLGALEVAFHRSDDPVDLLAAIGAGCPCPVAAVVVGDEDLVLVSMGELPVYRVGRRIERLTAPLRLRGPLPLHPDEAVVLATSGVLEGAALAALGRLDRRWPTEDLTDLLEATRSDGLALAVGAWAPVQQRVVEAAVSAYR